MVIECFMGINSFGEDEQILKLDGDSCTTMLMCLMPQKQTLFKNGKFYIVHILPQ